MTVLVAGPGVPEDEAPRAYSMREIRRLLHPAGPFTAMGFDIHAAFSGGEETSGGWFDFLPAREGRVGLMVGEVMGRGLPAVLSMAGARAARRAFLSVDPDPAVAFGRRNELLCGGPERCPFLTLFHGDLHADSRTLRFVRAGHNPPLLYRRGTDAVETLDAPGSALGRKPGQDYRASDPLRMGPGDLLLLSMDDLVRAVGTAAEPFGVERAGAILRGCRNRTAGEIGEVLRAVVGRSCGPRPRRDDPTLVVVKSLG